MKAARVRYQRLFSRKVDVSKTEAPELVRCWEPGRPSFKEWAAKEFKGSTIASQKLRGIVGRRHR